MKSIRVLLSLITRDNDYQREQASVAEATAQRLGIGLQVVYADSDAIGQTKQILSAINAAATDRPDAVIAEPVGTGMLGVASAAADNGIGWIVLNREADYLVPLRQRSSVPIGSIECDNTEVGRIQGRQFAALLPAGGTILYIEGPSTDVTKQRRAGLDATLPPNIRILPGWGKWTEESGYEVVASRLQLQGPTPPNVGLIGCQNDAMAMGARRAVETLTSAQQRAQWMKVPFTGVDGVPTSGQVWVQQRRLAATVVTPALTGVALELLAKAIATSTPMPERTLTRATSYPSIDELRERVAAETARV
ncbi:MAG TPA: sugar ABC transporter substrate-binding protein [Gemmatimonadales bacterium]|nr:sugar ABC transporter substrate-binding protein [Gemmatimonadales bacterium]